MSDEKPSIEERIRRDVNSILTTTGRVPKLVYLVNQIDADTLVPAGRKAPVRLQLATSGGMVSVAVDRWCPIGSVHRVYECSCGALFSDDREKCSVCMMNSLAETICELRSKPAISTTCARCSATIDPAAVEQHHERCFMVGDRVRWSSLADGRWVADGSVTEVNGRTVAIRVLSVGANNMANTLVIGGSTRVSCDAIRHIQRPGQAIVYTQPGYNGVAQLDETQPTLSARLGHLKHGPGGSGLSGPCDADCRKCQVERDRELEDAMEQFTPILPPGVDPLDVKYGGVTLRHLLTISEACRREGHPNYRAAWRRLSDEQRAAVSAHWSQQLRARISAAKERDSLTVRVDLQDEE